MALLSSKLPVIWIRSRSYEGWLMVGAEITMPSRTIASWRDGQVGAPVLHSAATVLNLSMPSSPPLKMGFTTHEFWGKVALASLRASPFSAVGPSQ